jgi:hypothetical protein
MTVSVQKVIETPKYEITYGFGKTLVPGSRSHLFPDYYA